MVNDIKGSTEIQAYSFYHLQHQFISANHQSFVSVQYMQNALLYRHAESMLLIYSQRNSIVFDSNTILSKCLLRADSRLIGLLLESENGALPFLCSGKSSSLGPVLYNILLQVRQNKMDTLFLSPRSRIVAQAIQCHPRMHFYESLSMWFAKQPFCISFIVLIPNKNLRPGVGTGSGNRKFG